MSVGGQIELVRDVLAEMHDDGIGLDVGEAELLDYMAIMGVAFVKSDEAALAYQEVVQRRSS